MAQAELNIGTVGHVDHGKSTLTQALTGKFPDTHSQEIKRGITIKLGYADFAVYQCAEKHPAPQGYSTKPTCPACGKDSALARRISIVDAPGHETLMATVIAASSLLDGALFVIAANEKCPQPQTAEHLLVLEAAEIKNVIVVQNKIDLVTPEQAKKNHAEIKAFLKGTAYENAPIVPVSANARVNLDALLQAIQAFIPTPAREQGAPLAFLARSFDVNKPGTPIAKLKGGIVGGSLVHGALRVGDEITILPGVMRKKKDREAYDAMTTKITSLSAGGESVQEARPGGLIGIGTLLDPSLTHGDSLSGSVAGPKNALPPVLSEIRLDVKPLERRAADKFPPSFIINEPLVLGVGTAATVGFVQSAEKQRFLTLKLKKPVPALANAKIAVMRRAGTRWHLYGVGRLA